MPHNTLNYTKCVVIVHGKSEFALVKYIYTNLHLPVKIIAKDKGRGSIQINGLPEYLRKKQFRTLKEFANEYSIEYDRKTKSLKNFKLFIPMSYILTKFFAKKEYQQAFVRGDYFCFGKRKNRPAGCFFSVYAVWRYSLDFSL